MDDFGVKLKEFVERVLTEIKGRFKLLLAVVYFLPGHVLADYMFEYMREACPYTNFCTVNQTKSIPETEDRVACCLDCSCDQSCEIFGDCCPDYMDQRRNKKLRDSEATCRRVDYIRGKAQTGPSATTYRVVDFCPFDYVGESKLVENCKGNFDDVTDFDNYVLVSEKSGGTYMNKHCAYCHGLTDEDMIRWDLVISGCTNLWSYNALQASNVKRLILEHCTITSILSDETPRNARTLRCVSPSVCGLEQDNKLQIYDVCENGPYMPYIYRFTWYRNAMCFKCKYAYGVYDLCVNRDSQWKSLDNAALHVFLDTKLPIAEAADHSTSACRTYEMLDFEGKCRRFFCPPLHAISNGRCVPISTDPNIFFQITVALTSNLDLCNKNSQDYLDEVGFVKYATEYIEEYFDNSSCEIKRCGVVRRPQSPCLVIMIVYAQNPICNSLELGEHLLKVPNEMEIMNISTEEGKSVNVNGQITFLQMPISWDYMFYYRLSSVSPNNPSFSMFFLCQYFILGISEYNDHVIRTEGTSIKEGVNAFTYETKTMKGFFPISNNTIAVCVHNYHSPMTGGTNRNGKLFCGILLCVVVYSSSIL